MSPWAPILVERVIEDIVEKAIIVMKLEPDFWGTYVDDHLTSIPPAMADKLKGKLNSYNPNVQFTMEIQSADGLTQFLDTTVYNDGQNLKTKWFHKPIASNRLLNYYSKHPTNMVINTAKAFIRRVFTLSHASFHKEIKETIKKILDKNNFPKKLTEQQVNQLMVNRTQGNSSYALISRTNVGASLSNAEISVMDLPEPIVNSTLIDTTITPVPQQPKKNRFAGMTYIPGLSEAVSRQIGKYAPDLKIAARQSKLQEFSPIWSKSYEPGSVPTWSMIFRVRTVPGATSDARAVG